MLVGQFKVSKDVRFHYWLLSTEADGRGYDNGKKPVVFSVRAVADRQPTVSIPVPGRRKQVTPTAKVPLEVEAAEDVDVAGAAVPCLRVRETSFHISGSLGTHQAPLLFKVRSG